jgi:hypothetical protein
MRLEHWLWRLARRVGSDDAWAGPLRTWARWYKRRYVWRNVMVAFAHVLEEGAGLRERYWPVGTPREELLPWFDEAFAVQRAPARFDHTQVALLQGEEGVLAQRIGMGWGVPKECIVLTWSGTKAAWWSAGRDQVAQAILPGQSGLYGVTDSAGMAFGQLLDRWTQEAHDG